ncbi:DUF262 domain-containing protein [Lachnospiraceae bacterium 46-15]
MEEKAGNQIVSEEDIAIAIEGKLEEAVETAQDISIIENVMIQTVTTQMGFRSLMFGLESGDYVIPGFQRMYRWTEEKVEELANSLVRGMPIPPIYCYRNKEHQQVILDGQQRILSLYLYYIGKFLKRKKNAFVDGRRATDGKAGFREYLESCGLVDKQYCMRYKDEGGEERAVDITYKNLSSRLKRRIDFEPITFIEINVDSQEHQERILHKIFANLNIGGLPLSAQELRNGIYHSEFYNMLYDINDNCKKWRMLYSGNLNAQINKSSKDVELLLQMCAFRYYVKGKGGKFILDGYKGKIASLLDDFSEEAKKFDKIQIEEYRKMLRDFFDSLEGVSGRNKNLALVSLFVVWGRLEKKPWISKKRYDRIISSDVYRETISSGTSGRNEIERRLRSVYEQLSGNDSENS